MLRRAALPVLGIVEHLRPRQVVDFWMGLATTGDAAVRRWVYAAARLEGLCLVLWAVTRGRGANCDGADDASGGDDPAAPAGRRIRRTDQFVGVGFVTLFTGGAKVRV